MCRRWARAAGGVRIAIASESKQAGGGVGPGRSNHITPGLTPRATHVI